MFKCQKCNKTVPAGQPTNRIVVEKREREYEKTIQRGKLRGTVEVVQGWEIAKELLVCPECYSLHTGRRPRVVEVVQKPKFEQRQWQPRQHDKPWRNPRNRHNNNNRYNNNQQSARPQNQQQPRPQRKDTRPPIVETVNKIQTIKG